MATSLSLFLMPSDDKKQEPTMAISTKPAEPTRTTTTRTRKPTTTNKCQTRKKQPRRGMGVAQLENLRIQERWKAITETNQIGSLNLQPAQQMHVFDPFNNNDNQMVQCGTTVNYGVPMRSNGVVFNGFLGWDHQDGVAVKRVDEFNANNYNGGFGSGQVLVNPYMVGSSPVHQAGAPAAAVREASKELSSIPKVMQKQKQYDPTCLKMGGFSARAATSAFYANHNHNNNEGVEAMAVPRKGNNAMGRKVIMEYEFFPGKNGKNTCFKDMESPTAEASVAVGTGEASCVTTYSDYSSYSASDASNSIDLSLKLSF
ncbi:PROTEIN SPOROCYTELESS [Salix purpurea]|uniref:PROTEIN SPOROCYTELESS n=1 Tax=Salix purpurea TaxID=77065 RepID=A0A9Q0VRI0_SALPP|nr:PROTEIN SPOROCYTELESS [Salix purpurea]